MYYIKINKLLIDSKQNDYFSKNDLYVKINFLQNDKILSRKTQVIYNNNKPIWNEIFLLENANNIEILLYEKGKFMDKLISSKRLLENKEEIKNDNINQIEVIHGNVCLENKKKNEELITENINLKNEIKNKNIFIEKLSYEKDKTISELSNKNEKINNEYKLIKNEIDNKSKIINNIKLLIN